MYVQHHERHRIGRIGWLRAAVLGANDGIISTASLLIGVAAADTAHSSILIAGFAGLIAGALSMAAGEYISVSSQADTEKAELARERMELATNIPAELEELTVIYEKRGLERSLAAEVATQLMAKDALGAHARDELGITEVMTARPLQAALFSAGSFTIGALLPLFAVLFIKGHYLITTIMVLSVFFLALLGATAAFIGGSNRWIGMLRVTIWGTLAMLISAGIGHFLGVIV